MSTTVKLRVTPRAPVDPDLSPAEPLPDDVAELFVSVGQRMGHGFSRRGEQPWQWWFHLSGPTRVQAGQTLKAELGRLGYDADLDITR